MTIYDIAREAGVSASSVSRVVNNKPGVNRETREKINSLLEKYHYVPNEAARGLVTSSSKMVGILIADVRTQHHIEGAYHIARELTQHGYCSLILNTGGSDEEQIAGMLTLVQHKVEAAVLMGSIFQTETMRDAIARSLPGVPVFILNGYLDLPNVYGVLTDEKTGVADCVALLAKKEKERIAFLVDKPTPSSRLKTQGFQEGMATIGWKEKPLWIYEDVEGSLKGGYLAMKQILREHPEVNGVVCSLDLLACGALRALMEADCCRNVRKLIWEKMFTNVSASVLTAVLQMPLGYISNSVPAWALCEKLVREAVEVAGGDGLLFDAEQKVAEVRAVCENSPEGVTSICSDLKNGRKSEVDTISGSVLRASRRNGVSAPTHEAMINLIHAMEERLCIQNKEITGG